ncbi:hypothetical protein RB195_015924 [Necator americanus]|uniref:Uncharacterized protein n=1 Tax=Necator americanus TaxID=51031 RepID=A0ABR1E8P7_NECAM
MSKRLFPKLSSPATASLAFTTDRGPTYMDRGATLRQFAKTRVNLSSGLLLANLPTPESRSVGCVELFSASEILLEDEPPLCIVVRRPESPSRHYEAENRC